MRYYYLYSNSVFYLLVGRVIFFFFLRQSRSCIILLPFVLQCRYIFIIYRLQQDCVWLFQGCFYDECVYVCIVYALKRKWLSFRLLFLFIFFFLSFSIITTGGFFLHFFTVNLNTCNVLVYILDHFIRGLIYWKILYNAAKLQ